MIVEMWIFVLCAGALAIALLINGLYISEKNDEFLSHSMTTDRAKKAKKSADKATIVFIVDAVLLALFFAVIISTCCPIGYEESYNVKDTEYLYAMGSGLGVRGSFVFGCGSISDVQYYIGYTNIGGNDYKQVKYDAKYTTITLDDDETPRYELLEHSIVSNTFLPFIQLRYYPMDTGVIYIPTDGLSNTYKIN